MFFKRLTTLLTALSIIFSCMPGVFAGEKFFKENTYIEAESGVKKHDIYIVSSPYSSGGKHLVSNSASLTDSKVLKTEEFSYTFDFELENDYKLFMRVYFPGSAQTEIFWKWNTGEWKTFAGTAGKDYAWFEIGTERLRAGKNKLSFAHKSTGVYYDMIYLSSDPDFKPADPEGVEPMPEVKAAKEEFKTRQEKECIVTGDGVIFEAEDASLQPGISVTGGQDLSGGKTLVCTSGVEDRSTPLPEADGWIEFTFSPDKDGLYAIWARTLCTSGGNDSWYVALGNEKEYPSYVYKAPVLEPSGYTWTLMGNVKAKAGERFKLRIRPRENYWGVDQFLVTGNNAYLPVGIETEVKFKNNEIVPITALPPVNPPANEHPRLMFRASDIERIKKNIDHPKNAQMKEKFFSFAKGEVNLGDVANDAARFRIEAKALYYALYGDKKIGQEAVDLAQKALSWEMNKRSDGQERAYELIMTMHSRVYDWCYDLMTKEQMENIHNIGVAYGAQTEMLWPPNGHGGLTLVGHGAEMVLLRGMLSFAIATYDERPDYWNYIGGRFYEDYVPERAWHQKAQMHHQGVDYGYFRHQWSCWAAKIVMAMGADAPYDLEDAGKHAYSHFTYARRPDGSKFKWGDWNYSDPMQYHAKPEVLLIMHSIGKDPYVTDELMRHTMIGSKDNITHNFPDPATWLLLFEPDVEPISITNLPNSYYFGSPMGVTFTRTGWEDGVDSNTVSAVMFINEWEFGNHQHKDRGSFQLWYRGPLASESGIYDLYGTENHKVWTYQSTAHNTLIVYDPEEDSNNFTNGVNDGGQIGRMGHTSWQAIQENPEKYQQAKVLGQEIDPENPIKPYYTYLKGDLTKAYSDKISDYSRSFMFLDLKEEKNPAALIVFDRVETPKANLEKRWLLHGQAEPEIKGTRSVWGTLGYVDEAGKRYTGKMVVDSLLPADSEVETDVIGGEEEGWCVINGVNYPHENVSELREDNTYRMEKRTKGKNLTYFLNCLQVTDESNQNYYKTKLLDTDKFYGVEISDRVVLFSKEGKRVSSAFEIKGQSTDKELRYTVCDIEKGKWKITADGAEQTVYATEEGGVLAFSAKASSIKIEKIDDSEKEKAEVVFGNESVITVKEAGGSGSFVGFKTNPEIKNGRLMVPVAGLATTFGLKTEDIFLGKSYTDAKQGITLNLKPESGVYTINSESKTMENPTYYKDGQLMVELRTFAESFNYNVYWEDTYKRAFVVENKPIVPVNLPGYAAIVSLTNDDDTRVAETSHASLAGDGVLTTLWSAEGKDRYFQVEFDKEYVLENAEIVFNPNSNRTPKFEVQISTDGKNFETAYDGVGWSGTDGLTWETFKLDVSKPNRAKYVRYVGKGSNISDWNAIREIRFKIGEDLVTWEEKDSYAKVSGIRHDDGEIDPNNVGKYLIDNNNRTLWATFGNDRYVDFILENTEEITGLDIVFNPNTKRTAKFEILISEDDKNYVSIFNGQSDPNALNNSIEHYDFDKTYKAKYVRYKGLGSDISQWNGVKEIRVIKK